MELLIGPSFCLRGPFGALEATPGPINISPEPSVAIFWSFRKYNAEIYSYPRFHSIWGLLHGYVFAIIL